MIGYDDSPTVRVYHQCADYAAGSVWPDATSIEPAYWWAVAAPVGWRIRILGVRDNARPSLEASIRVVLLDGDAAGAAAAAQDARAEAPDV